MILNNISIHAPMRGATLGLLGQELLIHLISIHAPMRGATLNNFCPFSVPFYFNPRTHARCDDSIGLSISGYKYFNPRTHARCDATDAVGTTTQFDFNPRTHARCDRLLLFTRSKLKPFQSTHPCEVRRLHRIL